MKADLTGVAGAAALDAALLTAPVAHIRRRRRTPSELPAATHFRFSLIFTVMAGCLSEGLSRPSVVALVPLLMAGARPAMTVTQVSFQGGPAGRAGVSRQWLERGEQVLLRIHVRRLALDAKYRDLSPTTVHRQPPSMQVLRTSNCPHPARRCRLLGVMVRTLRGHGARLWNVRPPSLNRSASQGGRRRISASAASRHSCCLCEPTATTPVPCRHAASLRPKPVRKPVRRTAIRRLCAARHTGQGVLDAIIQAPGCEPRGTTTPCRGHVKLP